MRIIRIIRYAARLILAIIVGVSLAGFSPATAQASINPVDLELGGEGATPWVMSNVAPGDSGTKMVELHNAGSGDGFVTIWVSDIVSGEGENPESETGDTAEPGEFADYLLLDLKAEGLVSNANLPVTISDLPQSAYAPYYIEIIPLKAGDTVFLRWDWELLVEADNDVQGDNVSFTINYLLREFEITDVSDVVTEEGVFTEEVIVESETGNGELIIEEDTVGQTEEGEAVTELWLIELDKQPSALPEDGGTVALSLHYDAGPHGTTFDQPITITISYDPNDIPPRASEADLVIAVWDEDAGDWVELEGCIVDMVNNTISAPVSHFSRYTTIAHVPPPPPPPPPPSPEPTDEPPPVEEPLPEPSDEGAIRTVETNMLGSDGRVEIAADGTLHEPLKLTDSSGNFIIDIDRGTKITGSNNMELSRIVLTMTEESLVVPDDIVILSPVYKLTGYTQSMEVTRINFDPSAKLTIFYDPRDLPENAFPPFIATYTDEIGLVQLEPPPDAVFEVGKAKTLIHHASLFAVMAELAPPPPPLPATFEVSNLTINPGRAELGQPVVISLTIANEGAVTGSYELYLIVDGIVRAVKEIDIAGQSIKTISFEVSNLAAGKHQVKIAGLTGEFRIIQAAAVLPAEVAINWLFTDLSVGSVIAAGLLVLYLVIRRSQRLPLSDYSVGSVVKALKHKNEG